MEQASSHLNFANTNPPSSGDEDVNITHPGLIPASENERRQSEEEARCLAADDGIEGLRTAEAQQLQHIEEMRAEVQERTLQEERHLAELEALQNEATLARHQRAEREKKLNAEIAVMRKLEAAQVARIAEAEASLVRLEEARHQAEAKTQQETEREQRLNAELAELNETIAAQNKRIAEATAESCRLAKQKADLEQGEEARQQAENEEYERAAEERRAQAEAQAQRRAKEEEKNLADLEAIRIKSEQEALLRRKTEEQLELNIEALRKLEREQRQRISTAEAQLQDTQAQAQLLAEEQIRLRTEVETLQKEQAEARQTAAEEMRLLLETEVQQRAAEETKRLEELEAIHCQSEAEAQDRTETEHRLNEGLRSLREAKALQLQRIAEAEAESRRLTEETIRLQAEEEARQKAESEARQRAFEENIRLEESRTQQQAAEEQKHAEQLEAMRTAAFQEQLQLEATQAQQRAQEEQQHIERLEAMRRSAEQAAHQRNARIDQLNADVAALKELEFQQSNQIQEAEAQLREFETGCQRLSEEAASEKISNEPELDVKQASQPAQAEEARTKEQPHETEVEGLHPLETWQFPVSDELAAINGLEQAPKVIPEIIPRASQPKAETDLELELQAELSRLEVAASPSQTARQDVAKSTDLGQTEEVSGDQSKISGLLENLMSNDPAKRSRSIEELAELDEDEAFYLITDLFDDSSTAVRNAAARALYEIKPGRVASLTRAFREASAERRLHIAAALTGSGLAAQAIESLTGANREKTYDAFSILFLMAKAGEVEMLLRTIERHPDTEVQLSVIKLLTFCNRPEIIPGFRSLAIRGALPTKVRSAVMDAIYQISSNAREKSLSVA